MLHTPKRIPTFMVIGLLSLGNNVFVDSLYEPHLNPPSALSDHCESVACIISNGPHSAAYCNKLGPNGVKADHHFPTHSLNNRLRLATATNHQGYEDSCDACINVGGSPPFLPG